MITHFLFSSPDGDVFPGRKDLERSLLLAPSTGHSFLKLKDYFQAVRSFLMEDHRQALLKAVRDQMRNDCFQEEDIRNLIIRSEKQGALYHVASVEVEGTGVSSKFSLVAAVSEKSRDALERECNTIILLNNRHPSCGLPRIHFRGERPISRDGRKETFSFLLEEWLEGYHEWHISRHGAGNQRLCIWDQERGYYFTNENTFFQLFRQAARTLTLLYDPETGCQLRPWHHAAGDFVIRDNREGETHVRLVAARGYEPLLTLPGRGPESQAANLLYFFLDMALRMRLDRFDGVGEAAWIEGNILDAVMAGFLEGLEASAREGRCSKTAPRDFLRLINTFSPAELLTAFEPLMEIYRHGVGDEFMMIAEHLPIHVRELCSITAFRIS
jgi:hypothetical protein